MDRHVIANMGAELGATTTVFPSDEEVRRFLRAWTASDDWVELVADAGATTTSHDEIDLSSLEPLIAMPSSPGNVVPVREVAGPSDLSSLHRLVGQSRLPRLRDRRRRSCAARRVHDRVSFDVNPTSRQISRR